MGYGGDVQLHDLMETIRATPCDVVVAGTPIDLARLVGDVGHPVRRVTYELRDVGEPTLAHVIARLAEKWVRADRVEPSISVNRNVTSCAAPWALGWRLGSYASLTTAYQIRSATAWMRSPMRDSRRYTSRRPITSRRSATCSSSDIARR